MHKSPKPEGKKEKARYLHIVTHVSLVAPTSTSKPAPNPTEVQPFGGPAGPPATRLPQVRGRRMRVRPRP